MNKEIKQTTVTCPTRIDLAGGTLDLWPIYLCLKEKATINIGIDLKARCTITLKQKGDLYRIESKDQGHILEASWEELFMMDHKKTPLALPLLLLRGFWTPEHGPLEMVTKALSPQGAGLGGSSALGVAILAAILKTRQNQGDGTFYTEDELVAWVQHTESLLIHSPSGIQDYWGAVRGGVNLIHYSFRGPHIQTIPCQNIQELTSRMIVYFSGVSRLSGINNWNVYRGFFDRDPHITKHLEELGHLAFQCAHALEHHDIQKALQFSYDEWHVRKFLWPAIETQETKTIDRIAKEHGAWFSRVCGAGGGGAMVIFVEPERKEFVLKALENGPGYAIQADFSEHGLTLT